MFWDKTSQLCNRSLPQRSIKLPWGWWSFNKASARSKKLRWSFCEVRKAMTTFGRLTKLWWSFCEVSKLPWRLQRCSFPLQSKASTIDASPPHETSLSLFLFKGLTHLPTLDTSLVHFVPLISTQNEISNLGSYCINFIKNINHISLWGRYISPFE